MRETVWQKWCTHLRAGGFVYALYRGFKYILWRMGQGRAWKEE